MSNVFTFTGTVSKDAEVRTTPSGQSVLTVLVANNIGYGDKQQVLWIRATLWGRRAEGQLVEYLKKGQPVFVSGELSQREYQANDGSTRISLELNANILDLVGGKRESGSAPQSQHNQQKANGYAPQSAPAHDNFDLSDDIPF